MLSQYDECYVRYESKLKYHNHQWLLNMVTDMLQQPSVYLRKFGINKKHSW